jgi:FKBP-type peptidyl-prolyl cis-trans isomerase
VFGLDQVIAGWTQGVPGMKAGGTRRLIIPSEMAYGSARASKDIPPNSDLVFDIDLIEIVKNGA